MRAHFYAIVNQHAGNYRGYKIWQQIQEHMIGMNVRLSVLLSAYPGAPEDLAYDLASSLPDKESDVVVLAFGGDGTLHEVLNGLIEAKRQYPLPLAYIPTGSGNDFARGAGLKSASHWKQGLSDLLRTTHSQPINIGSYQLQDNQPKRFFMNSFGIGFDGSVLKRANQSSYKNLLNHIGLGAISYLIAAVFTIFKTKGFPAKIQGLDLTKSYAKAYLMIVTNHPYFGGGIKVAPDAKLHENNLKFVLFQRHHLFQIIIDMLAIIFGGFQYHMKAVDNALLTHDFTIEVNSRQTAQVDGKSIDQENYQVHFSRSSYPFWLPETINKKR
ncbi:diacylglycerol/lipid kinase family protein [Oenococcus sp.]|uniref:diacylglycerol/lipid kinase family protein n=1 Tax=Oenococcus sp. TaxID=1979414 RepID=UPI0039ED95BA